MATISARMHIQMEVETCWVCGCVFGMESSYAQKRKDSGKGFQCPNGCRLAYGESETDKLKREVEKLEASNRRKQELLKNERSDRREAEGRLCNQIRAHKGVATKLKNRAAAGMCPCCHRTFQNLKRHMNGQHPGFKDSE